MSAWNTWPSWGESKQLPDKILYKIFMAPNIVWCGWRYQGCILGIQNNSMKEQGQEKYLDPIVLMSNLYIFTSVSQWNEDISKSVHNRLVGIVHKGFFINCLTRLSKLFGRKPSLTKGLSDILKSGIPVSNMMKLMYSSSYHHMNTVASWGLIRRTNVKYWRNFIPCILLQF